MAMSDAERQQKRRLKLKQESKTNLLVQGVNGQFDERIRVALAVKELANDGVIPIEVVNLIIVKSGTVFPNEDLSTQTYIRKIVTKYLKK